MAGICSHLARSLVRSMKSTIRSPQCLPTSWVIHTKTIQPLYMTTCDSGSCAVLCRHLSNLSLSSRSSSLLTDFSRGHQSPQIQATRLLIPIRTVVKHSKLGKMKTVKAVAKRFRRTGSGKLKFWPPGNVHNLLSKSHDRKCRIRKPRYANKTQRKTLNKMLIGRYS